MDLETDFGSRKEDRQPMFKAWRKHHCDDFTNGDQLTVSRNHKLIFDIGFHSGEDSLYFLKRGYDVVAVDANPSLIEDGLTRPVMHLARLSGQFHALARGIVGRAAQENQTLTFYVHRSVTEWSTFVPPSRRTRGDFSAITVPITTCGDLIRQFGTPYYMKVLRVPPPHHPFLRLCRVPLTHGNACRLCSDMLQVDIEGFDKECLRSLEIGRLPTYLSTEDPLQLDHLLSLGYRSFRMVSQSVARRGGRQFSGGVPEEIKVAWGEAASIRTHPFYSREHMHERMDIHGNRLREEHDLHASLIVHGTKFA
jgi:hypothetical protein